MGLKIENDKLIILNPETLDAVGEVRISSNQEVEDVLTIASKNKEWSSLSLKKRCSIINKFRKVVLKHEKLG